jgi:hypothetical protein
MARLNEVLDVFITASAREVRQEMGGACEAPWASGLQLSVTADRGELGVQWAVGGPFTGSAEVWVEAEKDGVVVHWFLRSDDAGSWRRARRLAHRYASRWHVHVLAVKDRLEAGRDVGVKPSTSAAES